MKLDNVQLVKGKLGLDGEVNVKMYRVKVR